MIKFRRYIANTVQFFYEETFFLFLVLLLLVGVYESYYLVELLKIPHNLDPQTLKIFEDFFKTPFGEYIILGVFLSYIIIETIFLFSFYFTLSFEF